MPSERLSQTLMMQDPSNWVAKAAVKGNNGKTQEELDLGFHLQL